MSKIKNKWLSRALCAALAVTLTAGTAVMTPIADFAGIPTGITANATDSMIGLKWYLNWSHNDIEGAYYVRPGQDPTWIDAGYELTGIYKQVGDNVWTFGFTYYYEGGSGTSYYDLTASSGMTPTGVEVTGGSGSKDDPYVLTPIDGDPPHVAASGINLSPNWDIPFIVNRVIPITATVSPKFASDKTVVWSVNNSNVALYTDKECTTPVGSEATSALTVYAKGVTTGEATVTVTSAEVSTVSASYPVTVGETDPMYGTKWYLGWSHDLPQYYYKGTNSTNDISNHALENISYSTNTTPGQWCFEFSIDGSSSYFYFDGDESNPPTGVEVTGGSGIYDDPYIFTLIYDEAPYTAVSSIAISPDSARSIFEGDSTAFTAKFDPKYATDKRVIWSVNNSNVVLYADADCTTPVGSEATDALTVYAKGAAAGEATVTVTSAENTELSASCDVEIIDNSYRLAVDYELTDSYGDGWTGNQIIVREQGSAEPTATLTLKSGSSASGTLDLIKGKNYELVWVKGNYSDECSFSIVDPYTGETISANGCSGYSDGEVIAEFNVPKLFAAHSITLDGNIGVNFYIAPAVVNADIDNADSAVVKFTWDNGNGSKEVNLKEIEPDAKGWYKATCDVAAAYMAHKIHAEVYINGTKLEDTDDYSVQDYAETIIANPSKYDNRRSKKLKALAEELLNYGAMAQTVFDSALNEKPELANTNVRKSDYSGVTVEAIQAAIEAANPDKTAADLSTVGTAFGAKYYTNSLIFLSQNTMRIYFAKADDSFDASAFDGSVSNYCYVERPNIAAQELDTLQEFTVGSTTFCYSALDYAKAVINSNMAESAKNLAKSLYLYNQAANAYFAELKTYTKDSEGIADGVIITNEGDMIDTSNTSKVLLFDCNVLCDYHNDGDDVFDIYFGSDWDDVNSFFINENNEFICYNYGYTSKFTPDEGMTFKVSYDSDNDIWIITAVDLQTQEAPQASVIYTKDSEGIADGVILENPNDRIYTIGTSQSLVFGCNVHCDYYNDGDDVFDISSGREWGDVYSFFINDNNEFICYNDGYTSKFTPDEGKQFKVSYDADNDVWHITQV